MTTRRHRCPVCTFLPHPSRTGAFQDVELRLGGRAIARMRNVCFDCTSDLMIQHGFRATVTEVNKVVLDLKIAGMHSTYGLIRVGSRAKGESN